MYLRGEDGKLAFHPLAAPTAQDVAEVAALTAARLRRVLQKHGRSLDEADEVEDTLASEQPVLASCYAASAGDVQLLGKEPGARTGKLARPVAVASPTSHAPAQPVAEAGGVNVHAKTIVDGRDKKQLERLCRYIARPPLAQDRLARHHDGRLRLTFKRPWKDGTSAVLLDPLDLIGRLCALVPPPRWHMLRYHGVLAGHAKLRPEVVATLPPASDPSPPAVQLPLLPGEPLPPAPAGRHPWTWLLERVFCADVSKCPGCGKKMRIIEIASTEHDAARVLFKLGLGPRPPPRRQAVLAGQLAFAFDDPAAA